LINTHHATASCRRTNIHYPAPERLAQPPMTSAKRPSGQVDLSPAPRFPELPAGVNNPTADSEPHDEASHCALIGKTAMARVSETTVTDVTASGATSTTLTVWNIAFGAGLFALAAFLTALGTSAECWATQPGRVKQRVTTRTVYVFHGLLRELPTAHQGRRRPRRRKWAEYADILPTPSPFALHRKCRALQPRLVGRHAIWDSSSSLGVSGQQE
jgi:hypothetical protein